MRISDWSSDVCSPDLGDPGAQRISHSLELLAARPRGYHRLRAQYRPYFQPRPRVAAGGGVGEAAAAAGRLFGAHALRDLFSLLYSVVPRTARSRLASQPLSQVRRQEERRVGKEGAITWRARWS